MPTLSSSLVKHQVASMEDVEEALSRQAQYGGDLVTNLLELASVSEEKLTPLLAEMHGLEPAPVGELPRAEESVRKLVPGELAHRYSLYALEEREGLLSIAVSEPLPAEVEADMAFSLGVGIVQRLAPLVRVRQAIARDYGFELDQRLARVLGRLAGRHTTAPPAEVDPFTTGIRPATLAPPQALRTPVVPKPEPSPPPAPEPPRVQTAVEPPKDVTPPSPEVVRAPPIKTLSVLARSERQVQLRPRRLGPYTVAMAEKDLLEARTRDDVLRAFFDFASQYFEYSALFAVHADLAEGRDAHGPGASRERLLSIGVPLDLPSALSTARDAPGHALVRLGGEGLDAALAKDLERRPGRQVLLLPVRVRNRCVLILYGDHGSADVLLETVGDVIAMAPLVSGAVERLILQRKRPRSDAAAPVVPPPRPKAVLPSPEERAQALASVLEATPRSSAPPAPAPPPEPAPELSSSLPPVVPERSILPPPLPGVGAQPLSELAASSVAPLPPEPEPEQREPNDVTPSTIPPPTESEPASADSDSEPPPVDDSEPPPVDDSEPPPLADDESPSVSEPPPAQRSPFTRPSLPALSTAPKAGNAAPASIAEALSREPPADESLDDEWEPREFPDPGTHPGVYGALDARRFRTTSNVEPTPSAPPQQHLELVPEVEVHSAPYEDDEEDEEELSDDEVRAGDVVDDDDVDDGWSTEDPSDSRIEAYDARPLRAAGDSTELKLPSVIVDIANDCRTLLDQLIEGDESAADKLVEIGTAAVTVLVQAFPGPLKHPSLRPGAEPAKASDCGPVLKTLLRLGSKSVPFLVVRTNDGDPVVRKWATHLLGELPAPESVHAVARRFFDTDDDVRRVALLAARAFLAHPEFGALFVAEFGGIAQDTNKAIGMRLAAIEALSDLRHALCVPELIHVLPHGPPEVSQAAERALSVVTRQDFGSQAAAWAEWWRSNGGRHRIEWLIDALTHESQEIRRSAGEELKALTREYFGYYDDLPPRERERAQLRYLEWWETRGKARFH